MAQNTAPPSGPAPTLNALGIAVADMAASLAFYRLLGLDIPAEADGEEHVSVELPGGMRLMWDAHPLIRSYDPGFVPPAGGGPGTSLAFECADPPAVDALYAAVTGAGFTGHLAPWDAPWRQRYATLRDPDGNGVDLYAALPAR